MPQLLVVMPVYNEQASISKVAREWFAMLDTTVGDFVMLAINDGSTDQTDSILTMLNVDLGPRFEVINHSNRGHGQSCIQGYKTALEREIPFILQIDSDGQSNPLYLPEFWSRRAHFDVIYGKRTRQDGLRRILASMILRLMLRLMVKVDCVDANVPYRLMNASACGAAFRRIPSDLFLANIALAVALRKDSAVRHGQVAIGFPPRYGGESSVPFMKFAAKGIELFRQLRKAGIA